MVDAIPTQQARALLTDDIADDFILSSAYEIENILLILGHLNSKAKWFKDLKKARNQDLDREVKYIEERQQRLRDVILRTMKQLEPDRKTLQFPSVGKVSRRQTQDSWVIDDEKAFLDFAEERGFKNQVLQIKESIDLREAKKVIADLSQSETIPGTSKKDGTESISISFEPDTEIPDALPLAAKLNLDDLDGLDV